MKFSEFILNLRKNENISQEESISYLQGFFYDFSKLDQVTFSRWENGVTVPSLMKQVQIAIAFKQKNHIRSLAEYHFQNKSPKLIKLIKSRFKEHYNFSDSLYVDIYDTDSLLEAISTITNIKQIGEQYLTFHKNIYHNDAVEIYSDLVNESISCQLHECLNDSNVVLGHLLSGVIELDLFYHYMPFEAINREEAIEPSHKALYIISEYSIHEYVARMHIKLVYEYLLDNDIDFVFFTTYEPSMIQMYEQLKGEVVYIGPESEYGVKFEGRIRKWLTYKIPSVNILASELYCC